MYLAAGKAAHWDNHLEILSLDLRSESVLGTQRVEL
jgi:hypothetical protein